MSGAVAFPVWEVWCDPRTAWAFEYDGTGGLGVEIPHVHAGPHRVESMVREAFASGAASVILWLPTPAGVVA